MRLLFTLLACALVNFTYGGELLVNKEFEEGNLSGWYTYLHYEADKITIDHTEYGNEALFSLGNGGTEAWHVLLMQVISVRPGYKYHIAFGGAGIEGDRPVTTGLCHNGSEGYGGDGSDVFTGYLEEEVTFPKGAYKEFSFEWDNTDVDDNNVRFLFHAGGLGMDFKICWASVWESPLEEPSKCRLTQLGFYPDGSKRAVVKGVSADAFEVRNGSGSVVYNGTLNAENTWKASGEAVRIADFSDIDAPGAYALYSGGERISDDFTVAAKPLSALGKAVLKAYYYQRASTALSTACAGSWSRSGGHPDNSVTVHESAGCGTISAPKGWYDAGDYGKYIISSGITVFTLLTLYSHFPDYFDGLSLNIPESSNSLPDILDEVRWNLEWMLAMQTADGGVYSKLTPLKFDPVLMPSESSYKRYVFMKTTPAALDFAAVTALSSRIYTGFDAAFASQCLEAAKKAYAWAMANPSVEYVQPADCETGEYRDTQFKDEFFWASVELAAATGNDAAYSYHTDNALPNGSPPDWGNVGALGFYTIVSQPQRFSHSLVNEVREKIISLAGSLRERQKTGYGISMKENDFYWGSNSVAASQGIHMLYAYYLTGDDTYRTGAEQQIDYLLGRNPLSMSFVTGFGTSSPRHPHQYISEADGITAPVPGFLVGGPNVNGEDVEHCEDYIAQPASSWLDKYCSYASNEVAINWNAALSYLVNALEAVHDGHTAAIPPQTKGTTSGRRTTQRKAAMRIITEKTAVTITPSFSTDGNAPVLCRVFTPSGRVIAARAAPGGREFVTGRNGIGNGYYIAEATDGTVVIRKGFYVHR